MTDAHKLQSKVQVIRNTAYRPSTQASFTVGSGTTMQENQLAAQIAAEHNIFPQMAPYMSWIFLVQLGIDPGVSRLGGEIVSHYTTDARQVWGSSSVSEQLNIKLGHANWFNGCSLELCSVINTPQSIKRIGSYSYETGLTIAQGYSNFLFRVHIDKFPKTSGVHEPSFSAMLALIGGPLRTRWRSGFWTAVRTLSYPALAN